TRTSEVFTFELTSNPTWIGVKALPYLAEYPYDCTEQIANRLFANTLATRIIRSQPRIAEVFEQWRKDSNALKSPLAVNETLKTALLEETPWVREAADESEQQARIATLFDIDRMASEQRSALNKLVERQSGNGSFAWFPGGRPNRYITQYVVETLTRMDELKAFSVADDQATTQLLDRSLTYLEGEMKKEYDNLMELREQNPNGFKPGLSSVILHYLYVRSHWANRIKDRRAADALTFFSQLSETEWVNRGLYEQALMAVTFRNTNRAALATRVLVSLRERALHNEKGMFWKYERSWNWNALPLETHCRLMEAFQLIDPKPDERTALQQWLLLNKQTNRWETTKATAAAVHALLIDADERLTSTERIDVKWSGLDKNAWQPRLETAENSAEAGSGYYQVKFTGKEITPGLAEVRLRNKSQVLAWGGLYHTYTEDIDKVNSSVQSPLKLDRQLFRRISTPAGQELENYGDGTTLTPGDRITVRLTVTTDRDMEFVHLKDRRGSGLEPATTLSGYRYQDGLGFYFSPTDLAVNYFFDYLPRGTYLLEYDLFVVHRGEYSNGLSVIQSMYAPS
ncbi:MAG: alpha-2-macroglobulin, partial [Saprospiraceae bacterium]